jgi:hypothetical protein
MGKILVKLKMTNMNLQEHIRKILREETSVNSKEDKLKYLVFKLINRDVEGADLYEYEGSIWLIFTNKMRWVIELTKEGTLWYNYSFFESIFKYISLDVIGNQHYITEWVEDTIQNGVRHTKGIIKATTNTVRHATENGTKIGKIKND